MKDFEHQDGAAGRLEEAARWRVLLSENDGRPSLEFEIWLRQAGSQAAWDQVSRAWAVFDGAGDTPAVAAARRAALTDAERAGRRLTLHRLAGPLRAIAAAILLAVIAGGGASWWLNRADDYQTGGGERRVVTLSDGSRLSLDSNSEVTVKYVRHQRLLHLLRGQARFDVAHDASRPFSVVAGSERVIATGTAFNIDMAGPRVLVTLIEGHVVVVNEEDGRLRTLSWPGRIELKAGQQLAAAAGMPPRILPASIPRVTAWTVGQLIFDNESLSSVVDRINRYSDTQIVVADPAVGEMKISGVFNTGDAQGFVDIVTRYLRVRAVSEAPNTIALQSTMR
jgi:transmembrane sensor